MAAGYLAPYVICDQPAILRSPRDKPCYWTCVAACAGPCERLAQGGGQAAHAVRTGCEDGKSRVGHSVASFGICPVTDDSWSMRASVSQKRSPPGEIHR
jgi:hypothetical protein